MIMIILITVVVSIMIIMPFGAPHGAFPSLSRVVYESDVFNTPVCVYTYIYIYIYIYIFFFTAYYYVYIYIEREIEREIYTCTYIYVYVYMYICIYIYIYTCICVYLSMSQFITLRQLEVSVRGMGGRTRGPGTCKRHGCVTCSAVQCSVV